MNATRRVLLAIASTLAVTSLAARPGAAATLPTPNFPVSPPGHGLGRVSPAEPLAFVSANTASGDLLVVWTQADRQPFKPFLERSQILGQLVKAGAVRGGPIVVTTTGLVARAVAFNSTAGEYLVAYSGFTSTAGLFGRRVAADGTLLGGEAQLVVASDGVDSAAIAYNPLANEFLVAWRNVLGLFIQRVDALGAPVGGSTMLASPVNVNRPGITFNPATGQYFVTWVGAPPGDPTPPGTDLIDTVFGQLIDGAGTLAGAAVAISTQRLAGETAVALDSTANRYLVVWRDDRNSGNHGDIFGRLLSATGTLLGDELVISTLPLPEGVPQPAYDPMARVFLVAWNAGSGRSSILGQFLEADGSRRGELFAVAESDRAAGPTLAAGPHDGTFTVAWGDGRAVQNLPTQVFAQTLPGSFVPRAPVLERLVFELALNVLARPPAQSEVLGGAAFVRVNPTPAGVAALLHMFFDSDEFTGRTLSLPERVRLLYEFVLGREPSDAEEAAWVSLLAARLAGIAAPPGSVDPRSPEVMKRALFNSADDLVDRFFGAGLGRSPSARERVAWASAFGTLTIALGDSAAVPRVFVRSPEFLAIPRTLGAYVAALYRMFLARDPTAAERDTWVRILLDELQPVLAAFAGSPEFRAALADVRNPQSVAPVVTRFYEQLLGRTPAASERDAWVAYVTTTADLLGFASGFFRSPEYLAAPRTLAQHVTVLYRAFLGREPADGERAAWVDVLSSRVTDIVPAFANSTEYAHALFANALYRTVLARPPTDGEVSSAATFLLATGDDSALVRAFLASAEFAARRLSLQDSMRVVSAAIPFPLATGIFDIQRVQAGFQQQQSAILDAFVASPEFGLRVQRLLR